MDEPDTGQIRRAAIDLRAVTQGETLELDQEPWRDLCAGDMIVLEHSDGRETTLHIDREIESGNLRVMVGPPGPGLSFELHFLSPTIARPMMTDDTAKSLLEHRT